MTIIWLLLWWLWLYWVDAVLSFPLFPKTSSHSPPLPSSKPDWLFLPHPINYTAPIIDSDLPTPWFYLSVSSTKYLFPPNSFSRRYYRLYIFVAQQPNHNIHVSVDKYCFIVALVSFAYSFRIDSNFLMLSFSSISTISNLIATSSILMIFLVLVRIVGK